MPRRRTFAAAKSIKKRRINISVRFAPLNYAVAAYVVFKFFFKARHHAAAYHQHVATDIKAVFAYLVHRAQIYYTAAVALGKIMRKQRAFYILYIHAAAVSFAAGVDNKVVPLFFDIRYAVERKPHIAVVDVYEQVDAPSPLAYVASLLNTGSNAAYDSGFNR